MQETTKKFLQYMDKEQIKYEAQEREGQADWVCVKYTGDNLGSIVMQFFFSEETEDFALRVFSIVKVPENRTADVLKVCNDLMAEYRWLRFYLDENKEVTAAYDATVTVETADLISAAIMFRTVNIVDECYPRIMKALWA